MCNKGYQYASAAKRKEWKNHSGQSCIVSCECFSTAIHHSSVLLADAFAINALHFYSLFVVWRVRVVRLVVWIIDVFILFLLLAFALTLLLPSSIFNSLLDQSISQSNKARLNTTACLCRCFEYGEPCSLGEFQNVILGHLSLRNL